MGKKAEDESAAQVSSKKKKKKKSKKKQEEAVEKAAEPLVVEKEKKSKKISKKKRKRENAQGGDDVPVAKQRKEVGEETEEERKAMKKLKREKKKAAAAAAAAAAEAEAEADKSKKKKKKKSRKVDGLKDKESANTGGVKSDVGSVAIAGGEVVIIPCGADEIPNFYRQHPEVAALSQVEVDKYCKENEISCEGTDVRPIIKFHQSYLPASLLVTTKTFSKPSPIQAQCWPALLQGRDVIGIAKTGSGKTLGFALPGLLHIMAKLKKRPLTPADPGPVGLTLAPTRELAMQTNDVCEALEKSTGLGCVCVYGGADKWTQINALKRGCAFVVATPGRLLGLIREGHCGLGRVSYFVLDEADRMLDMGFEPDVRQIASKVQPKATRQTVMFSATWPESIQKLAREFLRPKPIKIVVGKDDQLTANADVKQIVEVLEDWQKDKRLLELLAKYHATRRNRVIVFVLYKKDIGRVESLLRRNKYQCAGLSSNKSQAERTKTLAQFKAGSLPLLIGKKAPQKSVTTNKAHHTARAQIYKQTLTIARAFAPPFLFLFLSK